MALPAVIKQADAHETTEIEAASNTKTTIDDIVELPQDEWFILPDLDNSDALLREEILGISPQLVEWLTTDQLV